MLIAKLRFAGRRVLLAAPTLLVIVVLNFGLLQLAPGDEEQLTGQLNAILGYMDQLAEVDTTGVEPTSHVLPLTNVLRDDLPQACLTTAEALANAPAAEQGHFAVPKIIE